MCGVSSCTMNLKKLFKRKVDDSEFKGRTIIVNSIPSLSEEADANNRKFIDNEIISSHYKWWNFLPVNLFEQFHVVANFFFLLISILYFFGETPINPVTTIAPLVVVIGISMAKDAIDDIKRHKSDRKFNRNRFMVLTHDLADNTSSFAQRYSQDIHCGDIVICYNNSSFPCDMLILASSNSNGKVFITTDNLDGESSIKTTNALAFTQNLLSPTIAKIEKLQHHNIELGLERSTIICQNPCEDLKAFEGSLNLPSESIPLALNNVVYRGANLHHTTFMIGVAIYTGKETKLSLNGKPGFRKFSSTAGRFNDILLAFIGAMFVVTLIITILHFVWNAMPYGEPWYFFTPIATNWRRVQQYLTLLFIINYLIPISIMVTMELQQLVLAFFINKDVELYDPETNEKTQVNATNLADELGQIEFLFSDKTGTLTQNKMIFKSYSLANDHYVYDVEEEGLFKVRSKNKSSTITDPTKVSPTTPCDVNAADYFSFSEDEEESLEVGLESSDDLTTQKEKERVYILSKEAEQFWTNIVLNHSVEAKTSVNNDTLEEVITYNAASPDEKALIDAAAKVGITYIGLDDSIGSKNGDYNTHLVRFDPGTLSGKPSKVVTRKFKVDAVIEFNSVRKRMSVMVRDDEGRCVVYTKGAEVTMLDPRRCDKTPSLTKDKIIRNVTEFALSGLRTLVFARRELDGDTYNSLLKKYRWAQCQLGIERVRALEEASADIEANMSLIGVSAVEDKLQPGVRQCLQSLISAGIQIWVLTGDKEETAVQISQATGHFPPGTTLIRLTNGQSTEEVGRAIYVQQEGMKARLEVKKGRSRFKRLFQKRDALDSFGLDSEAFDSDTSSDSDDEETKIKKHKSSLISRFNRRFRSAVADGLRRHRRKNPGGANEPVGLVIDGATLRYAISCTV
ncbi:unnamed protein product [Rodentolepis nana]|uniref:Phospholipid-transporting ATPase n=1 Tax=Rodentolepis nana TaxID=102285 RepID=A0A0R3T0F9_RODNA|nr:unnamed protein product [Rodentolepis nana]